MRCIRGHTFVCWLALASCVFSTGIAQALNPNHRLTQYGHTAWRVRDGIPPSSPVSLAQTADGYLWVSTTMGMLRFDGARFVSWQPASGPRLNVDDYSQLLAARDGSLWISSLSGGLNRLKDGRVTHYPLAAGFPQALLEDSDNHIWLSLDAVSKASALGLRRLCRVNGTAVSCFGPQDGLSTEGLCCFNNLAQDHDGFLWLGGDTSLVRWKQGEQSRTFAPAALKHNSRFAGIYSMQVDSDGSLWVGMGEAGKEGGLQHFVDGKWTPFLAEGFDSSQLGVQDLLRDRHGALWIGTLNDGVYRIYKGSVDHFRSSDGLSSDLVFKMLEDREGNIWIATSQGLDQLRDVRMVTMSTHEGMSADEVDAVLMRSDGTLYAGTAAGLDVLRQGSPPTHEFPKQQITSMLEDHAGRLWIGNGARLSIVEGGHTHSIAGDDGKDIGLVTDITEDRAHDIWMIVSADLRKLVRVHDDKVVQVLQVPDIPDGRKVAADPAGGLWLGLTNGDLAHYRDGHIQRYSYERNHEPAVGTTDTLVNQIEVLDDGRVLAATGYGLIGLRDGTQRALTTRNGLPCRRLYSLVFDAAGDLWVAGDCGYVRVSARDLTRWWDDDSVMVPTQKFDALDGARPTWVPFKGAVRAANGLLYFASGSGLQVIDPAGLDRNKVPPPVYIENIRINQDTRDVEIDYTALSFILPQKVAFRYRLEGHDRGWVASGNRRQAFYTDLSPGAYRFHVVAGNSDGTWNERGATLAFVITPKFYQTGWFSALVVIAIALLIWSFFLLRLRQVKAAMRARLEERIAERERIARELHDSFLQGVQGLVIKFQHAMEEIPPGTDARNLMERALERADHIIEEGRDRVIDLRSANWKPESLPQAIATRVEELASGAGRTVTFRVIGEPRTLDAVSGEELQRICDEALHNACRHSGAANIAVALSYSHKRISLEVSDDGRGFDVAAVRNNPRDGHFGVVGLYERAKRIGGRLEINSSPGCGTIVRVDLNTRRNDRSAD